MEVKISPVPVALKSTASGVITGYAAVFMNRDQQGDVILPGAFKASLDRLARVPILWQHDSSQPIGMTMQAEEDDMGLHVVGQLDQNVQRGREALSLLLSGAVSGLSIGYVLRKSKWDTLRGEKVRVLEGLDLQEWSIATFPANDRARVTSVKDSPPSPRPPFDLQVEVKALRREFGLQVSRAQSDLAAWRYQVATFRLFAARYEMLRRG